MKAETYIVQYKNKRGRNVRKYVKNMFLAYDVAKQVKVKCNVYLLEKTLLATLNDL